MLGKCGWLACVLTLFLVPAPALADHAGPLAGQWHLDATTPLGGSGESTPDSSGHVLDAAAPLGITLDSGGRFANHLSVNHAGVLQPPTSALFSSAQVTLIAWIRQSGEPPTLRYIAGRGDDSGTCLGSSYALYTGTAVPFSPGLRFYIRTAPAGDPVVSPIASSAIWDGGWHMVAGVFDGAAVRLYVDGVQVGPGSPAPGAAINYGFPGTTFYFDGYPVPACGNGDFPGGIDEVRLYRRALTPTEIGRLAAAPGPAPPVLIPDSAAVTPQPDQPVTLDQLPPPTLGRLTNVAPVRGTVFVAVPAPTAGSGAARASQKGLMFVPLREARQIPVGSFLDTRTGTVRLRSAADSRGRTQTGDFASGLFQVLQSRRRSARGLTDLVLKGGSFARSRCTLGRRTAAAAARRRLSRRRVRRLRSNARGRFRTRGRYSSATVRGTIWDTVDRCDGTLTKVRRGSVVVRDRRRRKSIVVRAGKRTKGRGGGRGSYIARPG